MFSSRLVLVLSLGFTLFLGLFGLSSLPSGGPPAAETPRLAVLIYFDQLRGDYLTRWDALFGEGGFHRLEKDGAWFQNCHYPYSDTVTAAGHASVAAGCSPRTHAIVGNEWYDRAAGAWVNCVASDRYERMPPKAGAGSKETEKKTPKGVSPERLLAPTVADALKKATGGDRPKAGCFLSSRGAGRSQVLWDQRSA